MLAEETEIALTDALVCASPATLEDAVLRFGYPRERARLVESPIDVDRFASFDFLPRNLQDLARN